MHLQEADGPEAAELKAQLGVLKDSAKQSRDHAASLQASLADKVRQAPCRRSLLGQSSYLTPLAFAVCTERSKTCAT